MRNILKTFLGGAIIMSRIFLSIGIVASATLALAMHSKSNKIKNFPSDCLPTLQLPLLDWVALEGCVKKPLKEDSMIECNIYDTSRTLVLRYFKNYKTNEIWRHVEDRQDPTYLFQEDKVEDIPLEILELFEKKKHRK